MAGFALCVAAEKHLNTLLENVQCIVCSNILLTPVESACHHVACARCFSSQNKCPVCGSTVDPTLLHPNDPLSKRSAAVLQTIKAYEAFSGRNVAAMSSLDETKLSNSDQENSEDWFFKKDKKFSKKYEKKKRESSSSKLLSVSQNDTPLIFPGEVIDTTQHTIDSEIDKNPNAIDKVQDWLSISQINVGATVSKGPVRNIYPERMRKDFFQRKTNNLLQSAAPVQSIVKPTRSSKRLSDNKSVSSPTKSSASSTPVKNVSHKTKIDNTSPTKSNKSLETSHNSDDLPKTRTSKRVKAMKLQTNKSGDGSNYCNTRSKNTGNTKHSPRKSPNKSNESCIAETPTSALQIDSDTSNNYSFKANDSELKSIFSKVLQKKKLDNVNNQKTDSLILPVDAAPSKNENNVIDNPKDKNPWKNVRKMKKVLNKHPRSNLKKLEISVAERNIPAMEQSIKEIHCKSETPIYIDDVISQSIINEKNVTPEVIRRYPSVVSLASSVCVNPDSPEGSKRVDKDYLACQAAIIASKQYEMYHQDTSASNVVDDPMNSSAEPPLTHLSPIPKDKAKHVERIFKKLEGEMVVSNILKDFEEEEDESEYSTDISTANSSAKQPVGVVKSPYNLFDSLKSDTLAQESCHPSLVAFKQNDDNLETNCKSPGVPFVYKGRLNHRKERKVPFYYKSKCTSKDWYNIPQDGLNIELHRDNILTSIVIRNQPLVNVTNTTLSKSLKLTQMRDAQTSPIPFLSNYEACSINNLPQHSTNNINLHSDQHSGVVSYRMHPNLQRFTNCIVPSIHPQLPQKSQGKKSELVTHEHTITHVPERSNGRKSSETTQGEPVTRGTVNQSTGINMEVNSPPLIVSEPTPDSLFNTSKKRKFPQSVSPISRLRDSKKSKTLENSEYPVRDDINVVFISQTQTPNTGSLRKSDNDSEPMNYDVIMGTVMANIDRDLGLLNKGSGSRSTVSNNDANKDVDSVEAIDLCKQGETVNSDACDLVPNTDLCSFIPSQRKAIEDETDLRIVSMEVEPVVACTNHLFQNTPEKKSEFIHNTLIENDKTIENLMTDSKQHAREIGIVKNVRKCTDTENKILETSLARDNSQIKDSDNMFSTMFDKNTIGFSQDSNSTKPDGQIVSSLNLPQSIQQLRDENSKYLERNNTLRHVERTVELSPHEELLLTPSMKVGESLCDVRMSQDLLCTPITLHDDSDSSMVEDTPQKVRKFTTVKKSIQESSIRTSDAKQSLEKISGCPPNSNNKIDFQNINLQKQPTAKKTDTPMSKFSDDIKVCSTPVGVCARRSLSYKDNLSAISEDDEVAGFTMEKNHLLRQSTSHTATCMEKEFLEQAFESSIDKSNGRNSTIIECSRDVPKTQRKNNLAADKNRLVTSNETRTNICVACSCLTKAQISKVKDLVGKMGWKFTNEYINELSHLVVGVDENNKSQRSIKYVQALAAGKWIVSFNWVEKCMVTNSLVSEGQFEVLDSSGEMGPYISRTREIGIFDGFTFYCCPPFSVISHNVLTHILEDAGANIVDTIEKIEVKDPQKISILIAEPSSTEDDRFYDIVLNHKVVPINFEWVTECLGEGTLCNAGNFLLVPRSLLPRVEWPLNLTTDESMDVVEIN